jgi:hypothetical protein
MPPKKNSAKRTSRFCSFIAGAPLLNTLFLGFAIWIKYVLIMKTLESRMLTVERVSPEKWDLIYRTEINFLIQRNYYTGAILVLWFAYLVWKWRRAFRVSR